MVESQTFQIIISVLVEQDRSSGMGDVQIHEETGMKIDITKWNKEVFGDVNVRYAELEYKIRKLDEQDMIGIWTYELT